VSILSLFSENGQLVPLS